MGNFSFTATAECDRCGAYLSSSDEECAECSEDALERYHFERIGSGEIQTVWAINPIRAWYELHEQDVDDLIPWRQVETDQLSIHWKQMGYDVQDRDQLR